MRIFSKTKIVPLSMLLFITQILFMHQGFADFSTPGYHVPYKGYTSPYTKPNFIRHQDHTRMTVCLVDFALRKAAEKSNKLYEEYITLYGQEEVDISAQRRYLKRIKEVASLSIKPLRERFSFLIKAEARHVFISQDDNSFKALILLSKESINPR